MDSKNINVQKRKTQDSCCVQARAVVALAHALELLLSHVGDLRQHAQFLFR